MAHGGFETYTRLVVLVLTNWLLLAGCAGPPEEAPRAAADLVLRGARVYTVDVRRPWAEAVAVRDGRIVAVGDAAAVADWIGPATRVLELDGGLVLPGFHDTHVHPVTGGMELADCDLNPCETAAEVESAIRAWAAAHPDRPWVIGGGWQLPVFPGAHPRREQLDRLVPDRPAYLTSADAHSAWVNTRALEIAGITAATPDPPGGRIERAADGSPTGTLRENAMGLVARLLPEPGPAEYEAGLARGLAMARRLGITSLVEANATPQVLAAYESLAGRGELTARVLVALAVDPEAGVEQLPGLVALRERVRTQPGDRLRAGMAKLFIDGVIEAHTAALLEPYLDTPGDRGQPLIAPEPLSELLAALDGHGFQVHCHAIGTRAVRLALDAIESARDRNGARDARHTIAHLELVHPDDVPRFRALGAHASFQPLWAYPDPYITELTVPVIGSRRARWLYPIGSLHAAGAPLAFGSDWSVSSIDPLRGIEVAVTRRDPDAGPGPAWYEEECLELPTAIEAYTLAGARLMHQGRETGSIEVGKRADLVVLDRDLFALPPHDIHTARVQLTLLDGQVIHQTRERSEQTGQARSGNTGSRVAGSGIAGSRSGGPAAPRRDGTMPEARSRLATGQDPPSHRLGVLRRHAACPCHARRGATDLDGNTGLPGTTPHAIAPRVASRHGLSPGSAGRLGEDRDELPDRTAGSHERNP